MTAPDRDALVEKMARAMLNAETWSSFWGYGEAKVLASAALNMAMEEAARVARDCALYNDKMQLLNSDIRATCAAAIRAYISP